MKKNRKENILITGGSGFIGRHISKLYLDKNYRLKNLDLVECSELDIYPNYTFIKEDIRKYDRIEKYFKNVDCVIHLAMINGTENFYIKPVDILEIASLGVLNVCKLCEKYKIKKLIIFSSSEVYNQSKKIPTNEKVEIKIPAIDNPRFSYSGGKIFSELLGLNYAYEKRINKVVIIRPHNVYGPNMGYGHVIPQLYQKISNMIKKYNNKIKIKLIGDGNEVRSFIYIEDFISAFYKVFLKGKNREIYNIGNNEPIKIKQILNIYSKNFKNKILFKKSNPHKGGPKKRCPEIKKIIKLGYRKRFDINKGIKNYILYENKKKQNKF